MTNKIQPYNYLTFQNTEKTLNYLVNTEKLFCLFSLPVCALFSGEFTSENFQQPNLQHALLAWKQVLFFVVENLDFYGVEKFSTSVNFPELYLWH